MLKKHLIAQTEPIACKDNLVLFDDYRITVLSDRLFRIEKNPRKAFCDSATQCVWFRNMPPQDFQTEYCEDSVILRTARVSLYLYKNFESSYVELDGKKVAINNDGNLLGTTRTLDCFDGTVCIRDKSTLALQTGVCSRSGVAVVDDSGSLRLLNDGTLAPPSDDTLDIYVFAYDKDYRAAVNALYSISGKVPMLPRFAFGNWWSRYYAYSDKEYLHLMKEFEKRDIPLTVATLDMDWHYSANVDEEMQITKSGKATLDTGCAANGQFPIGWTGYSWNKKLFPDYKAFLKQLKNMNLHITLNLHPSSGVRYFEDMYPQMAQAMGIDPKSEKCIPFNLADANFVKAYFEILHHPYEKDGVDFWWIDWQQGTSSAMEGLDPLWALNHYHYLDNARNNSFPLIMSRYAGVGSHRYPIGFSGDTTISWKTLELMPYFTAIATNIGYTWWGHDIGGHHLGIKDDELYLRFLQFGVFNPINRLHCTSSPIVTKEPWEYQNGIAELAQKMLALRHRMIPLLYSQNYRTHTEGIALIEPLYYQYPDYEESYSFRNQYIFAEDYIVAPITHPSEYKGLSAVEVFLPEGVWTDIFTSDVYTIGKGGRVITMVRSLDSIPVLARSGSVMLLSNDNGNSTNNPLKLEANIYNGNGNYTLYEDNGNDKKAFTVFHVTNSNGKQTVNISFTDEGDVIPQDRDITLVFKNINGHPLDVIGSPKEDNIKVSVYADERPVEALVDTFGAVSVTLENVDVSLSYTISVEYDEPDALVRARRGVVAKLMKTQDTYEKRNKLFGRVSRAASLEALRNVISLEIYNKIEELRLIEAIPFDN